MRARYPPLNQARTSSCTAPHAQTKQPNTSIPNKTNVEQRGIYGALFEAGKGPGLSTMAHSIVEGKASIFHAATQMPTRTTRNITHCQARQGASGERGTWAGDVRESISNNDKAVVLRAKGMEQVAGCLVLTRG